MAEEGMSNKGVVVSFYGRRGYGFIKPDGAEENLFVHHSEIQTDGYRTLREGQKVQFSVAEMQDGRTKAIKVIPGEKLNVKKTRKKRNNNNIVAGVECYNCGGIGHLARDCSSPVNVTNGGVARDRKSFYGECYRCCLVGHKSKDCPLNTGAGGTVSCYNCRQQGHFARECPSAASAS